MDEDAVRAIQRLQSKGFEAYLVGGCVRDLLLGRVPKDYDIATGARPQQVKRTFPRNCRIIGRRFKLAHLHFNGNQKILEAATFRRSPQDLGEGEDDLLITRDNEFGSAEEDARRRDFTVNALFLDPISDRIIDYVGGLEDIRKRVMHTIGDPVVRFREDPVRILRSAKFSGRLDFAIDRETLQAMVETAPDLTRAAPPRMLEEILRLLRGGHALDSFQLLRDVGALRVILPVVHDFLDATDREDRLEFWRTLEALDERVSGGEPPSNPVLLGTLFAATIRARAAAEGRRSPSTLAEEVLGPFCQDLRLPRRDAGCLKRICGVQHRFHETGGKRRFKVSSFLHDPYFREALELFDLVSQARGTGNDELFEWRERYLAEFGTGSEFAGSVTFVRASEGTGKGGDHQRKRRSRRGRDRDKPAEEARSGSKRKKKGKKAGRKARQADEKAAKGREKSDKRSKKHRRRAEGSGEKIQIQSRRNRKVKEIEPEPVDVSAFDVELDPKRVPTFGSIIESDEGGKGRKKKKRRGGKRGIHDANLDDYRPPPADTEPDVVPPTKPDPEDTFGDW